MTLGPTSSTTVLDTDAPASPQLKSVRKDIVHELEEIYLKKQAESTPTRSIILALPSELRSAIYAAAILDGPINDLAILRTCQRIYMESSPILFQRPVSFSSQSKLFAWQERSHKTDLRRVRTLSLRLTDVDLSSLITPTTRTGRTTAMRPSSAWSLYQEELELLSEALRCLPGLVDLTIVPPVQRDNSVLLQSMYLSFLGLIPVLLPRLRVLTVYDCGSMRGLVPGLERLGKVVFEEGTRGSRGGSGSGHEVVAPSVLETRRRRRGDCVKGEGGEMPVGVKMEIGET